MSLDPRWRVLGSVVLLLLLVGAPALAATRHPGAFPPLLLFDVSFVLMLALALPKPRRYGYSFLALFLFLGFWVKFNVHTLVGYKYKEPVGAFDGSSASWDEALLVSAFGALGVTIARLVQLYGARRRSPDGAGVSHRSVGSWYESSRRVLWLCTIVLAVGLHASNLMFGWYQIGVAADITLPAHGNVAMAWMVKLGLALWLATLVAWEARRSEGRTERLLAVVIAEAALATTASLSRGIYIYRVLPYLAALAERPQRLLRELGTRRLAAAGAVAIVAFVISLTAVSALRLSIYPGAVEQTASIDSVAAFIGSGPSGERVEQAFDEVAGLVIDRWNGLEGVMAVTAHRGHGLDLLSDAIREAPDSGENATYQRIAGADRIYESRSGFTFLTLPGIVAITAYSGSLLIVLLGVGVIAGVVLVVEGQLRRFNPNPLVASVAGMGMAVEFSQLHFPYLAAVFLLLLTLTLVALTGTERLVSRKGE